MDRETFIGRQATLRRLFQHLDWDRPASAPVLVLAGDRGTGKTALLERLKARSVARELVLLSFSRRRATPGELAASLFRETLEQVLEEPLDPELPASRWLDVLPASVRAAVGAHAGELRPGAHPARALRSLLKCIEGLARELDRQLVVVLDDPDCLGDSEGYPGVPKQGFPLHKFYVVSPWLRWVIAPRHPGSLASLDEHEEAEVVPLERFRRSDSYHLAALLLEREFRPVPRALLWPLHGYSDGRPGYLRALAARLVEDGRQERGVPGPEAARSAFLRELLEPLGRIGLACDARVGEIGAGPVTRAVLGLLARRGPLGVESVCQLTGIGRARTFELLQELVRRGLAERTDNRFSLEDRVLVMRLRALARSWSGDPGEHPALAELAKAYELAASDGWERRVRDVLRSAEGRQLPGRPFGASRSICCPAGGVEEAAVGYDSRGVVDGRASIVAADLLLNGRDRRWLVEMPRDEAAYDLERLERSLRLLKFFARTYRRPIERLWVASQAGFTPEARQLAERQGVLVSDPESLAELERSVLSQVA